MSYIARRGLSTLIPPKVRPTPSSGRIRGGKRGILNNSTITDIVVDRFSQCESLKASSHVVISPDNLLQDPFPPDGHISIPNSFPDSIVSTVLEFVTDMSIRKAIGAAQDAARMERVVSFYAGLPRGPAPQTKATGLLGRYQARYFNKNSAARK
ncbi:hypothetical protein N7539_004382 [Penicillium diatomitis]|uniref:Uncharacterized protein n=1 Tax=Penicillium diatomitis TaxID=2819901 RepID=A0A9X0BYR3_9EURO|nr:uncharacterized protein N7539_004382 [Penicillium diatomitis]KAJ5489492.1 hypothetical protein N7539_004382 [Penicillium diatomitis]